MQLVNTQVVEDIRSTVGNILYGEHRERQAVGLLCRRVDTGRTRAAKTAALGIYAHDKAAIRVQRFPGAYHVLPPTGRGVFF